MEPGVEKGMDSTGNPAITSQWDIGPRSASWDELWRRIMLEVLGNLRPSIENPQAPDYGKGVEEGESDA